MKINRWVKYSVFGLLAAVLTVIDQMTKIWIVNRAGGIEGKSFVVWEDILNFTYLKNDGASMGLLGGQRVFLIVLTIAILIAGLFYFKKHRPENSLFLLSTSLILSGAVGNLIDRFTLGYVRDFIDVQFIDFYIFNFADCAICIGAGLLILYAFLHVEN